MNTGDLQRIGDYWLAGRLGSGGQGVVYDAYDREGRRVALKVLHAADSVESRERFAKEAAAAERVASFCTARVLATDLSGSKPYIVSEFVPGPSLRKAVSDGRRFVGGDLHRLATAVATALTAIHDAGVIHRDLKPDNVLLGPDGPRVIDFGIARTADMSLTKTGELTGTPSYMAPEVFTGERAGASADVFAWGAIMLFAATGADPFQAQTLSGVMHQVLSLQPDLRVLPTRLAELVGAALAKDPRRRPAASDLLLALVSGDGGDVGRLLTEGNRAAKSVYVSHRGDPALGTIAEDAYGSLAPQERALAAEVFLRLVSVSEEEESDRRASKAELIEGRSESEVAAVERVLEAFSYVIAQRDGSVVLSRPALIRAWPRLRKWVEADRESLVTLSRISDAARSWAENGRKDGDLLHGERLDQALTWAAAGRGRLTLTPRERDFLRAGTVLARERTRRSRVTTIALAVLLVAALVAGGLAVRETQRAGEQRDLLAGRQAAAQADRLRTTDPVTAMLLSVAGWRLAPGADTRASLMSSLHMPERSVFHQPVARGVSVRAVGADGRMMATASEDGVRVYDVVSGRRTAFWKWPGGHGAFPISAALSPSGKALVVVAGDSVTAWQTMTGRKLREYRRPTGELSAVNVVFGDNETLVAIKMPAQRNTRLWDIATDRTYNTGVEDLDRIVISASGEYIAGVDSSGGVKVIRPADLAMRTRFPKTCRAAAFTTDSRNLLCVNNDSLTKWDLRTGKRKEISHSWEMRSALGQETVLRVSTDGKVLIGFDSKGITVWNTATGALLHEYRTGSVDDAWLEPSGKIIRYLRDDAVVSLDLGALMSTVDLRARMSALGQSGYILLTSISPDARLVVIGYDETPLRIWDRRTRRLGSPLPDSTGLLRVAFDPSGRVLVGEDLESVRAWDVTTGRKLWRYQMPKDWEWQEDKMVFTPDGTTLVRQIRRAGRQGWRFQLLELDVADGHMIRRPELATELGQLAPTRGGRSLVSDNGRIVDLITGERVGPGFSSTAEGIVATSPTGSLLAVGRSHGAITLWDYQRGVALSPVLRGESGLTPEQIVFSHDGSLVAAVGRDPDLRHTVVQLWDVATKRRLASVTFISRVVEDLTFSSEGSVLVFTDAEGVVTDIPIDGDAVAKVVCDRAGRTLTEREWEQYLEGVTYRDVCPVTSAQ